ncbi:MAG: sulfide/dihydroorotate dehydrogenase-like FAD/NAD-binding protein [bacterium]|nr:sulfide/dihydroorotate dehydrogenase-like FAD/NAD-binding protein [Candidatus Sumerlaeota bacterium]
MPQIIEKKILAPRTNYFRLAAPLIAGHAQPGQFVVIRVEEGGERIPITIADIDTGEGSITLIIQEAGKTTERMGLLRTGDEIRDVLGPLGMPSEVGDFGTVALLGGGFGIAAIHLLAKALRKHKNYIISIIAARTKELLIMEDEMRRVSDELRVKSDDGSAGTKGLVIEPLDEMLKTGRHIDRVMAVGPIPMMRAVSELTRPYGVKTIVSLNPVMVDGTGMCGGCRVEIGGDTKFACVDGPEFDAHLVNFDEFIKRNQMYKEYEKLSAETCRLATAADALASAQVK